MSEKPEAGTTTMLQDLGSDVGRLVMSQVKMLVKRASDVSGFDESVVRAGLLVGAGLIVGLLLRRSSDR